MPDGLSIYPDGVEQSGRTSYRTADSAENVRGHVNRVEANAGSYGGADAFVSALNGTRGRHARGAERASENRTDMGDSDTWSAGYSRDIDSYVHMQVSAVVPDQGVRDAI